MHVVVKMADVVIMTIVDTNAERRKTSVWGV